MKSFSFDILRLLLSVIVVGSHIAGLSNKQINVPFSDFLSADAAVYTFFALSGFFIVGSYNSSISFFRFLKKRFARVYPAYFIVLFFPLIVLLLRSTDYPFHSSCYSEFLKYFFYNALFLNFVEPQFCNLFENNSSSAVNGSLWTIKNEIMFYLLVPFLLFCRKFIGSHLFFISCVVFSYSYSFYMASIFNAPEATVLLRQFPALLSFFAVGMFFADASAIDKKYIHLLNIFLLFTFNVFINIGVLSYLLSIYCIFLAVIFGNRYFPISRPRRYVDLSYTIYLVHFPIIQFYLLAFNSEGNILITPFFDIMIVVFTASFIVTFFVEKPLLNFFR